MIPKRLAKQHKVSHFEEGEYFPATVTIAAANNGVGDVTTITLAAGDHFDSGVNSFPVPTMLAVFEDESIGFVASVNTTTPSAHTVTIEPLNPSQDVQIPSVIGKKVVFYSNAQVGGSGKIGSHVPAFERIDNYLHTFRADLETEDHEMQNDTWFDFKGTQRVYVKALDETANKFALQELEGLLITPSASGVTYNGKTLRTANGLIPQIKAGGINTEYFGDPTLTTLESAELLLDKYYGDDEMLFAMGLNADQGMRKWLLEFTGGDSKGISFSGNDKQSVGIDFTSARIGSTVFHFDTWKILTHSASLGADNLPYRNMIIGIPLGGGDAYKSVDGGYDAEWRRYFRQVYHRAPGPASKIVDDVFIWTDGALADTPTNDLLVKGFHMASYKALELFCINKFMLITKS
jgi:hypothetical protein